ncbi:hypothetical protein BCR42DRAFT_437487 [Absidia repens]|uniref:Uncharacterized protein n=1 Tax=Absidia repens TaxID=90262 RepID=A0A1X2IGR8_9FUNG|nr:hypothetical protein BCR42DRAFT_437487 [Absidia repens]
MRNEKTQNSNNNYNDRQAKLSYDHRDSEDVVMTEANIDYFENNRRYSNLETSEHKRSCRQKTEWNFTIPSETVDKDEGYINVKIPKKRLEIALAEHLSPDNTTRKTRSPPSLSSDDCPCNQQHRHHHYYHQYQYHHYHYHHPYYHYGQPVSYNNMIPLAYCSEISDNNAINIEIGHLDAPITTSPDHHDNKTDTTLIELNNGNSAKTPLPTSSTSPFTTGKKRTRAATKDDDDNGEQTEAA